MSNDTDVKSFIETSFDGDHFVFSCDLGEDPISLPWGTALSGYELVIGKEGILMGRLNIVENDGAGSLLSVSPEFPVMPD